MIHSNIAAAASYIQIVRRCYCEGRCPHNSLNGTCELKQGGMCFAAAEEVHDPESDTYEEEITYGCLPPGEGGLMQCKGNLVPHLSGKSIECCDGYDLCNQNLRPRYEPRTTTATPSMLDDIEKVPFITLLTSLTVCVTVFLILVAIFYLRMRRQESRSKYLYCTKQKNMDKVPLDPNFHGGNGTLANLMEQSSGSGSGLPILVQRTISKQLQMVRSVGKGRYGEVWQARWRGERVAVKIFFTTEEPSWNRETEIYQTVLMRHENILTFIAADIRGTGSWTQMILITDYHENGSLYDYLQNNVLVPSGVLLMASGIASGLSHLHTEIFGTRGKPAIAHRDIKSKNILVKRNGECCIADFGLAVKYLSDDNKIDVPPNERSGTKRYMAPEILDRSINVDNFDAHKMADMYSFSLVLWEISRRCVTGGKITEVDTYQVPYFDAVPNDPSFEDMLECVCIRKRRPPLPKRFESEDVLLTLSKIMQECWHSNPTVRLTALRVKKTLGKLDADTTIKIV